jgi:hypothetical protein
MVLLYPEPTVFTKHILVPLSEKGDKLGEAMTNDPKLRRLAIEHGLRNDDRAGFKAFVKEHNLAVPAEMADLNAKIEAFVSEIVATPANTEAFQDKVNRVHQLGNADIRAAASISNRLLQRPMHALDTLDQTSPVGKALIDLRQQIDDLNPKNYGDLLSPKKLFGIIPAGDKLRDYFDTYRSAQSHLNSIIQSLLDGQDELMKDNAAIEEEKRNAWALMKKLEQYVQLGKGLDGALDARLGRRILPESAAKRVERIQQAILDILSHAQSMDGEPFQLQIVRQTVNDYLPTVLQTYARLPAAFARMHPVRDGKTAQRLVEEQLALIEQELSGILVGLSKNDAQALIVHGEFLKKKLDSGASDILSIAS